MEVRHATAKKHQPKKHHKKVHHVEVEPVHGKDGKGKGHIVTRHFDNSGAGMGSMPYHEPEKQVFGEGDGQAMMAHLGQSLGVSSPAGEESPAPEPGAQEA